MGRGGAGVVPPPLQASGKEKSGGVEYPTLAEIRASIPPHCFQRSALRSLAYVLRNVVLVLATGWLYASVQARLSDDLVAAKWLVSLTYWGWQGTLLWGTFVLGHDCGHGSFSSSPGLNWAVGLVLHTLILTPYESWRVTHRHHHQNTGNLDRDEIFHPTRKLKSEVVDAAGGREEEVAPPVGRCDTGSWNSKYFITTLGLSWFMYLMYGYSPRNVRHFKPDEPLFQEHNAVGKVVASLAAYAAWLAVLVLAASYLGWSTLLDYYFVPLFVFGTWLVVTTFLHHTEPEVPWYSGDEWTFVKGALSSVDRSYSPFNSIIHNIGTHQIHHLFPSIPHYHLVEATQGFRAKFPAFARVSDSAIIPTFLSNAHQFMAQPPLDVDVTRFEYPRKHAKAV